MLKTQPTGAMETTARQSALSERTAGLVALAAIMLLAGVLRFSNLQSLGYVNHYYSAAMTAMTQSWHNFFFIAAEPGGSVMVDKPPLGLWIHALSVYLFGVNTLGLLLPALIAGMLSVLLLYHLVRRSFGIVAGLMAALALAITPVVVAVDRNNTMDSLLIFTLLLTAWAFMKATESGKLRHLLLGAALVGIGFNIKMLQAFLPLPAFYAMYLLGAAGRLPRKIGRLLLATLVLLVISLSWVAIVDLTPADQRPYVGSSGDNTELSLIVGYNGLQRLLGMGFRNGGSPGGFFQNRAGAGRTDGFVDGWPGGFGGTGQAGPLRLFKPPLSKETSWLLPFGILSALLAAFRTRLQWPLVRRHQAILLWGGWLLAGGIFFSIALFFHEYYLSMLAAPLAALVGIGVAELWQMRAERPWLALALLLLGVASTLGLQYLTAQSFIKTLWWLPVALGLAIAGVLFLAAEFRQAGALAQAGFACLVAAMLVTPAIWSGLTLLHSSANQSLPAAYDGQSVGPANRGGLQVNQPLLDYLEPRTRGMKYLMAVPSSMQGADYVISTGRPVLYLGGFMGQDKVKTGAELAGMVAAGELRYIYWDGRSGGGFGGGQSDVSNWVTSACTRVQGYETETRNAGAPDGTAGGQGGAAPARSFGAMLVTLYDCGQ